MSYQNRLDQILNKGIVIDVKEESKPKTADDRYLKINTLPDNNAKIEVDDTVSYLLKPLSFSDGINYIPIENLKGIFKIGYLVFFIDSLVFFVGSGVFFDGSLVFFIGSLVFFTIACLGILSIQYKPIN